MCEALEEVRDRSSGQSAGDADSYLKRLLSFEFLVAAIISWHVLAFTRPLTVALQAKECDVYKAYKMAQKLVTSLEKERDDGRFKELWQVALKISEDLGIEPSKKRCVRRQQNRTNPPVSDTEELLQSCVLFCFPGPHSLSPQNQISPTAGRGPPCNSLAARKHSQHFKNGNC